MPAVFALARAGVCSALEARDMTVTYISRLCELLKEDNERRSRQMAAANRGKANSLGQTVSR